MTISPLRLLAAVALLILSGISFTVGVEEFGDAGKWVSVVFLTGAVFVLLRRAKARKPEDRATEERTAPKTGSEEIAQQPSKFAVGEGNSEEKGERVGGAQYESLLSVGTLALQANNFENAANCFYNASAVAEGAVGPTHADTLKCLGGLARAFEGMERYGEAVPLYRRIYETQQKVLGENAAETLMSGNNLALALKRDGKLGEAENIFRDVLSRPEQVLGAEHEHTWVTVENLAGLYARMGKWQLAQPLYRRRLENAQRGFPATRPEVALAAMNLGKALSNCNQWSEATGFLEQAVKGFRASFGDDHIGTREAIELLAETERKIDMAEELNAWRDVGAE